MGFLSNMRRKNLYKQWIENSGLSPEDVPKDLKREPSVSTDEPAWYNSSYREPQYGDSFLLRVRVRYIVVLGFVFALLLIAISVVSTILVMKSC